MNKYKFKKHYPGSPNCQIGTLFEYKPALSKYFAEGGWYVHPKFVENEPEFWEKVEEKDYEILSFKYQDKIYTLEEREGFNELKYLKALDADIYSVRRLSDNEIFTVGNKIQDFHRGGISSNTITSMRITGNSIWLTVGSCGGCLLGTARKNSPLFVTEDGKEIFKGDYFYSIALFGNYVIDRHKAAPDEICQYAQGRFSTKEKAEEWIDLNKPKYSKADINKMIKIYNKNIKFEKFWDWWVEENE